jgi:hypothetical protein
VVAGVDVEQELALRKPKMKKSRKSKADVPTNIKAEPVKDFSLPSMVNIKTGSGTVSPPSPTPPSTQSLPYFKS